MNWWIILILAFLFIDLLLVIWVLIKRARRKKFSFKDKKYIKFHWEKILSIYANNPAQAVIEADKLLDFALGKRGFQGSMGEKLKKSGAIFSDINGLWSAHKLRNRAAHELASINSAEAKRALASFKKALKDLGAGL